MTFLSASHHNYIFKMSQADKQKTPKVGNTQPQGERRITLISKALSKLLRHQANKEGLNIDAQGFVSLREILDHKYLKSVKAVPDDVFVVVYNNSKQRFRLVRKSNGDINPLDSSEAKDAKGGIEDVYICAVQGHSIKEIDSYGLVKLTPDELPDVIVHGTYLKNLPLILESGGLSKMNRVHIHFAQGLTDALIRRRDESRNGNIDIAVDDESINDNNGVVSGMRQSCNVLIYLDVDKLKKSTDIVFYRSMNGVILTSGDANGFIKVEYFKSIVDIYGKVIVSDR